MNIHIHSNYICIQVMLIQSKQIPANSVAELRALGVSCLELPPA